MCGRTACALGPDVICRACSYYDRKTGRHKIPSWKDHPQQLKPDGGSESKTQYQYYPSANITPTRFTPVLFKDSESGEYYLQPMMWGMIPPWHKGEAKSHKLSTNNCRLEGIKDTKLYRRSLNKRQMCIILAQGFYEWKTVGENTNDVKQPYFIYMPQIQKDFKLKIADESIWNNAEWNELEGWKGPNLLMMAGLYDIWMSPENSPVFSYTIITMESNETLGWLHHRTPAILDTSEQVEAWLNVTTETSIDDMISILRPVANLEWYTVSTKVNNSKCHDMDCSKPVEIKENKSKSFMTNWLKKAKPGETTKQMTSKKGENEVPEKKPKLEDE